MKRSDKPADNDMPFGGPSEWYPYYCRACECKIWVEDIIVDGFPPNGPGKCPILCCPKCEQDMIREVTAPSFLSKVDPNRTGKLF